MSQHEDLHEQDLTHRQLMGDQHSPLITAISAVAVVWAATSGVAKDSGYKDAKHMLADAWGKVVTVVAAGAIKKYDIPAQALVPK